jgi:sugar phosphate isomerase/epimerase
MSHSVIGCQMYTLRDHLKTPADMLATCKRVKAMGYDAIQVSAFGPIEPQDLGKILKDTGLTCAATHVSIDLMKDVNKCLDHHAALGCQYTAIGGHFVQGMTAQSWVDFGKTFSDVAAPLAAKGLKVGYHNHSHELVHYDGKPALQILIDNTTDAVWFEIDTYWITHGGGDPAAWIRKVAGRIPCLHVKDMAITEDRKQIMSEVGEGNLNWPAILEAAKAAGVQWYLVERDSGLLDPFESVEISLKNLRSWGLK